MKKLLIFGALALTATVLFAKKQVDDMGEVFSALKYKIQNLKHLTRDGGNLSFDIDLQIQNPTDQAITLPANIETLYFYLPGKATHFATATKSIPIDLQANTFTTVNNINVAVPIAQAIETGIWLLSHNYSELIIKGDVSVAGQTISKLELV